MKIKKISKIIDSNKDKYVFVGFYGEDRDHKCFLTNGRNEYVEKLNDWKEHNTNLEVEFSQDDYMNILKCTPSLSQPKTTDKERSSDIRLQAFFKAACVRYQNDKKKTLLDIYEEVESLLKAKSLT